MLRTLALAAAFALAGPAAYAAPAIGAAAPDFVNAKTAAGKTISLADFKGKTVILEWTNHECPFVKKHYETKNMQSAQAAAKAEGAVWISVISSAPGKQGHVAPSKALELTTSRGAAPDHVVLDESGAIGRAFAAKTTPDMFVIDGAGTLRYAGAIDDQPTANHASVQGATNYVLAALGDLRAGKTVATVQTKPYGCAVKYAE